MKMYIIDLYNVQYLFTQTATNMIVMMMKGKYHLLFSFNCNIDTM